MKRRFSAVFLFVAVAIAPILLLIAGACFKEIWLAPESRFWYLGCGVFAASAGLWGLVSGPHRVWQPTFLFICLGYVFVGVVIVYSAKIFTEYVIGAACLAHSLWSFFVFRRPRKHYVSEP